MFEKHYRQVYTHTLADPPRETVMPPLQLDEEELRAALRLSNHTRPSRLTLLLLLPGSSVLPSWCRIFFVLPIGSQLPRIFGMQHLPKVTKPTLPKHLRPIGLSEVSSRVVGKVLQGRLRPYV